MPQIPSAKVLFGDSYTPREQTERKDEFIKAMTDSTIAGVVGETSFNGQTEVPFYGGGLAPLLSHNPSKREAMRKAVDDHETMAKSGDYSGLTAAKSEILSKEWSLSNPISTGLVPYDLEAPAKLLTPRPTPLRNSIPRVKGQGASRRFKVISGFFSEVRHAVMCGMTTTRIAGISG